MISIHGCKLSADVRMELYACSVIQTYAPDSHARGQTRSHGLDVGLGVMSHFAIKASRKSAESRRTAQLAPVPFCGCPRVAIPQQPSISAFESLVLGHR